LCDLPDARMEVSFYEAGKAGLSGTWRVCRP
jgi:hypothetical protein